MEYQVIGVYGDKTPHEQRAALASAQPEFKNWLVSIGCPAHIVDSVKRKNAALIERRSQSQIGQRNAGRPRSKNGVPYRWAQIEDGTLRRAAAPEEQDSEQDIARRRRMMAAIM